MSIITLYTMNNFSYADGVMGILQTDEQYLRRGYGSLVLKAAARKVAQMGHDIYSAVNEANIPSQKVVDRVGYNRIGYVYCIVTENAWNAIFPWNIFVFMLTIIATLVKKKSANLTQINWLNVNK